MSILHKIIADGVVLFYSIFTGDIPHRFLSCIGVARGVNETILLKFLSYLVVLCFERRCPKTNIVARSK